MKHFRQTGEVLVNSPNPDTRKELEGLFREKAKENLGRNQYSSPQISAETKPIETRKELEGLFREKAIQKEHERKTTFQKSEKSNLPTVNTVKTISDIASVSHDTIAKVANVGGCFRCFYAALSAILAFTRNHPRKYLRVLRNSLVHEYYLTIFA